MDPQVVLLVASFLILLVMHVPIAVALGLCALLTLASLGDTPACYTVAQRMSNGIASFPLLAIPFFIFAGKLMGEGGMARRLISFASAVVGTRRGALAYVSTLTCMMFGAISGSAGAAVSSVGGMMIPEMKRKGYPAPLSVAITTTAATTGLVIPPSNIMIVYAVTSNAVSVTAMFLAGVVPGIVVGLCLMIACWFICPEEVDPEAESGVVSAHPSFFSSALQALPSLLLIVIVLWGILGGAFSATEAAAIAVLYAFLLATVFYREVPLKDLPRICVETGVSTAVIFFLIGASMAMSWVMAREGIPQIVAEGMMGLSDNPIVILLLINLLLLFVGTFMDMTPAVLIFTPIFLPMWISMGYDPLHFGVVMIVNLCIGLCTPPVGTCLFIGCSVGKTSIAEVVKPLLPLFVAMFVALMLITYWPALSLWLPGVLGL
ncbi:Sialic acid TRAP transporter permease protein SiaT [Pseudobythopirellula maris]|uniref:Sialic acid TRAP transporter permease protein SiaT n=1 Tax=Pseudobythopirellula maris TaxID=2527991 RepID=A0A5C5ZJK8_9BACT|nr:TRAP transporter large permease [Pseudobythopirellula maris]TWT87370.1 Sialic acid TRAP transporter permease protein SiaT [Pseudobythopirellula maris]